MKITNSEIELWLDNDESLYNWFRSSRKSKRQFIKENKEELTSLISAVINREPNR
jgi:hypothetical protein